MPKKGHSEEQIVGALQRVESGEKVGAVSRGLGISQATYYAQLVADLSVDRQILREIVSKKL